MKQILFALRIAAGWVLLYAGLTKITTAGWSAGGYLQGAKTFTGFYHWLALPSNIGWVSFLNEWGLTLLGIALILGVVIRFSAILAAVMMVLYYFPILTFPYITPNSFIVDEHFMYFLVFALLAVTHAGRVWGLDKKLQNTVFRSLT